MKTKKYILLIFFLHFNIFFAQVGIGTTTPDSQLDIRSSNQAAPANNDGILIPKVDVFPATNPTAAQQGMLVYLTTTTTFLATSRAPGFYYWNNPTSDWIGLNSSVNGDHDWYESSTTIAPNDINDNMYHMGNVAIGTNSVSPNMSFQIFNPNNDLSIFNSNSGASSNTKYGIFNSMMNINGGTQYATYNNITNPSNADKYGVYNTFGFNGTGIHTGVYNDLNSASGTGVQTGVHTNIGNSGNALHYGTRNILSGLGTGQKYGIRNEMSGNGNQTGNYNILTGAGSGLQIGSYNEVTSGGNSAHTGVLSTLSGTGTGLKTGIYSYINPAAGGTNYGIYSEVLKPGATNFAGYFLGNVGIGTTAGNMYTLPPSRGTNGQIMQTNGTGVVTWQNPGNIAWLTNGNAGTNGGNTVTAGTNFLGTTDNQNIDFRTNNIFRARLSNLGEFFVGTLNTVITGDLANFVSNLTFPWATNGYSAFDGSGIYGQITAGNTIYGAVQGEYNGTGVQGTGVRGISLTATAGTAFGSAHTGVNGQATSSGTYKFGVYGSGGTSARSGGVMGYDYGLAIGALGYYANNGIDYSVYGFGINYQTGLVGGRSSSNSLSKKDTNIGLGIYGGVMGGWVRGMKYGFHTKGETYSLYVDGNGYTNKPLAYLISTDGASKTASYMSTSMKPEVTVNGKTSLENGRVFVAFDTAFSQIISNVDDVIITASPQGKSNGVYIDSVTKEGFWVYENNDGTSNVKISWIAITKIKGEENPEVPSDLLANDFDKKMDGVMFNENNTTETAQSLWWDGNKIRWDKPTNEKVDTETEKLARPKEIKK